jgi:hypothetical protein
MGVAPDATPRSATSLEIPVLFLVQWDDELVPKEFCFNLFGLIGSKDKSMHVNPGLHAAVPVEEIMASERFFKKHLEAKVPASA